MSYRSLSARFRRLPAVRKTSAGMPLGMVWILSASGHAGEVARLGVRQRDECLRLVHDVLKGVTPQPRAFPARGDQPIVAGEDGARPATRRRHLERRPAEVMDVNDVVVVGWLKPGMPDGVHLHAGLAKAVEQYRLRRHHAASNGPPRADRRCRRPSRSSCDSPLHEYFTAAWSRWKVVADSP